MGLALIIPNISFSGASLGQVTPLGGALTALSIVAESSYIGESAQLGVSYTPISTSERAVAWSIISGGSYATINNAGLLTILARANNSSIVVRCASLVRPEIYDEKRIFVTYYQSGVTAFLRLTGTAYFGPVAVISATDKIEAKIRFRGAASGQYAYCAFGGRNTDQSDANSVCIYGRYADPRLAIELPGGKRCWIDTYAEYVDETIIVRLEPNACYINDVSKTLLDRQNQWLGDQEILIGAMYVNNSQAPSPIFPSSEVDFYYLKVTDANNIIKANIVPQQDGTIIERVSGDIYTLLGTGSATYITE